jgi:predicted Zn finger-like uncharacterized protein
MIVTCPTCSARFQYGDARFQGARSKRFKCPKCTGVFEVMNPAMAPALPTPIPPPPQKPTETTSRKGGLLSAAGLRREGLPQDMRFSLAFLTGPNASTVRVLDQTVTVIGREEGDVVINDPETSRRHAQLEIHTDGTVWLSDLASTNGTFLQGSPIQGPTQLMDRQEFSCGRSTFMLLIRSVDSMSLD